MTFSHGEQIEIPSPIDVHVHLREPGGENKETIASGTDAALFGGYQAVFDMPNNPGGNETWNAGRLRQKIEIARRTAKTDIGFYAGANISDPDFRALADMVPAAAGLKLYMGHTTGNVKEQTLEDARPVIDSWIDSARSLNITPPILLHAREAIGSETAEYVARSEYPVHWCHIASATEASMAAELTEKYGQHYTGGVTTHHLTMTHRNADYQQGWNGARMQPPLGAETDAELLLHHYNNGDIQILETDHAPHTELDKVRAEQENPEGDTDPGCVTCFGISGIQFVLPVMTALVQRRKTTMDRVVDSLYDQPLKMLGLNRSRFTAKTKLTFEPHVINEYEYFAAGNSKNTPYIGWMGGAVVNDVVDRDVPFRPTLLHQGKGL